MLHLKVGWERLENVPNSQQRYFTFDIGLGGQCILSLNFHNLIDTETTRFT